MNLNLHHFLRNSKFHAKGVKNSYDDNKYHQKELKIFKEFIKKDDKINKLQKKDK